jgi:hypothetical protein
MDGAFVGLAVQRFMSSLSAETQALLLGYLQVRSNARCSGTRFAVNSVIRDARNKPPVASVAQSAEHGIRNAGVKGSTPFAGSPPDPPGLVRQRPGASSCSRRERRYTE